MTTPNTRLISIVIPTYNREAAPKTILEYIRALDGAFNGDMSRYEMIVVDDASEPHISEKTKRALAELRNVKVYQSKQNLGPGPARDLGIKYCSGTWIWFLDDDDELDPEGLKLLVSLLESELLQSDVIAHSLKNSYSEAGQKLTSTIGENLLFFREKQEVFNYILRREFLVAHSIKFSQGLHEDIAYLHHVFEELPRLTLLSEQVVNKRNTPGAITARMTNARIDGYLHAFLEIISYEGSTKQASVSSIHGSKLFSQTLGVILYCIIQEVDDSAYLLLSYLKEKVGSCTQLTHFIQASTAYGPNSSNFRYASSFWCSNREMDIGTLTSELRNIFNTRLSCKDLDSSLFLGPDEIRACCKRFFVGSERKGDVVLLKADDNITLNSINNAKEDLIRRINVDAASECEGCPYIERREINKSAIDYISLENFSYCNMRCTYCSPKYFGGTEASYNAANIIENLTTKPEGLSDSCHVVWGGGEPTLSPRFEPINNYLLSKSEVKKIRVLSNSLKHSDRLQALISDQRVQLVTSIDAGTPVLFREIRGKGDVGTVLQNLSIYRDGMADKRRLTIKYILMPNNASSGELASFVSLIMEQGLIDSMFQISCDFTLESASDVLVLAMYELATRLYSAGANIVFFDDLIRDRVKHKDLSAVDVRGHIEKRSLSLNFIKWPTSESKILLWGRGLQARWLAQNTNCGHSGLIVGAVGNYAEYSALENREGLDNLLIYPAGVQSMYEIIQNIEESGLSGKIFRGVLI